MIDFDEMPEDNAELAEVEVDFPTLEPGDPASCPVGLHEVVEYLRMESADGEAVEAGQLRFLRTAQVAEQRYWIWSFRESDGSDCFVTVSESPGGITCVGYEENHHGLSAEQFMLGDYHGVF